MAAGSLPRLFLGEVGKAAHLKGENSLKLESRPAQTLVLQSWNGRLDSVRTNATTMQREAESMVEESLKRLEQNTERQTAVADRQCVAAASSSLVVAADGDPAVYLTSYDRLLRLGRLGKCVSLLEDMKNVGVLDPHKIFQKRFFMECRKLKAVTAAFQFTRLLPSPSLAAYTQLISVCAAAANAEGAQRAFRAAQSAGIQPDCAMYTSLISAYSKTGQLDLAFKAFHEMENAGVEASVHTYSALIDGCARAKQTAKAFGVYGILIAKNLKPDRMLFHSLISACASTDGLDRAFDVLQDMKAEKIEYDHYTMSLMLDACTSCGKVDRAMGVYRTMRGKGAATTAATFTTAINACSVTGSLEQALRIYGHMKKDGIKPDETVFCALIKVATRAKQVDVAFSFLDEMRRQRVTATTKTYNSLLNLCCELTLPERAVELYNNMKAHGQKPTVVTFNALLQTLCNTRQLDRALLLLDDMAQEAVALNHRTYNILLTGCAHAKVVDVAFKLYHAADLDGKAHNLANCSAMLDLCYGQIRSGASSPSFSFTVGRFPAEASIGTPQQQWAACAVAIYRQNVAAGVIPSRPLLSRVLGCLHLHNGYNASFNNGETLYMFGGHAGPILRKESSACGLEDIYDGKAVPLYDEAASLGVVPNVAGQVPPTLINVEGLPSNAAEVCILSFLTSGLRLLKAEDGKRDRYFRGVTIKVPADVVTATLGGNQGERKISIAGRSGQAVGALLRRLGVPYVGSEASGEIQIMGGALQKWLKQQSQKVERPPPPPLGPPLGLPSYRQAETGAPGKRLGRTIAQQQMEIRMSSVPSYTPSNYYRRPSTEGLEAAHMAGLMREMEEDLVTVSLAGFAEA